MSTIFRKRQLTFRKTTLSVKIILNNNWQPFDERKSLGQKGSENGTIIYDIEHIGGARVTLEHETDIAPYATTLGVYGVMFHTRFDSNETDANEFISKTMQTIDALIDLLNIVEEQQDEDWKEKYNHLTQSLAEQNQSDKT